MNGQQLGQQLIALADSIDAFEQLYSSDIDMDIVKALTSMNEQTFSVIALLLNMPVDQIKTTIPKVIDGLSKLDVFVKSGEPEKISNMCRKLSHRPLILATIASFM